MEYPTLYVKQKSKQMADAFYGYNHNLRIGDSEFYDMKNMTSDYFPVLAPRGRRGDYSLASTISPSGIVRDKVDGLIIKDRLCYVAGGYFCMNALDNAPGVIQKFTRVRMYLTEGAKELISMGSYVIILPDRKYINTIADKDGKHDYGNIDATFTSTSDVSFQLCSLTGDPYDNATVSDTAPEEPENGQLWIDSSSKPNTLKKYSAANAMWVSIATTYIKVSSAGIGKQFSQYDGVKISGVTIESLTDLNGSHALWDCGDDYIIITGILDAVATQSVADGAITVSRKMPIMDFVVESNNRLWGCRYGTNEDGETVNEIYASKQGDFKNWNCFMNLSTDSYAVSCGTDGMFTGAITHMGFPLFFKENCIHKVYGDYPANFRVQNTTCRGVQKGSHKSLAIVNEVLYYKSVSSVCTYDGSLPVEVSSAMGDVKYSDAVAGAHSNKYYIDMKDADGVYHLFVYDTAKGMWHKEDNIQVDGFCSFRNELYAIDHDTQYIVTMLGNDGITETNKVPWMVETGLIGMSMPDMKYISRLMMRMSLDIGSKVEVSIQYDSIGDWKQVCQMTATSLRTFSIPIRLRRCDHFRIRIEGEGEGRIFSITKTIEQGSEIS